MRAIQHFLPRPRHTEIHRIFVNAKPEVAWQAARHFDMSRVAWVRLLFDIRTLPERLAGKPRESRGLGVDEITRGDTGFVILNETYDHEVVVGSVGQFWHLKIPFEPVTAETFADFDQPGFGKLAWSISVEPYRYGSTIALELRTTATDERSWKKLSRYYHVIGVGSQLIRTSLMGHLEEELGKMVFTDEQQRALPGDEQIPSARFALTHQRNIEAPPSLVWRYLMQLGCDRAGWYSIDILDNGGKPSVDHLVDGWMPRQAGDKLSATPTGDGFFNVYAAEPEKFFVIGGEGEKLGSPFKMTWAFVLEPIGEDSTHLVSRVRMQASPKWKEWLMGELAYPPVHGLMTRVQLDTIKKLAERDAARREEPVAAGYRKPDVEHV